MLFIILLSCSQDQDEIEEFQEVNLQTTTLNSSKSSIGCSNFAENLPICLPRNYTPKVPGSCRYRGYLNLIRGAELGLSDRASDIPCDNYNYLVSIRLSSSNECFRIGYELAYKYATTPRNCTYTRPDDDEEVPPGGGNQ